MCGRYASTSNRANLLEQFVVDDKNADELKGTDYNVAPTKKAPVVVARVAKDAPEDDPVRELRLFRWGFFRTCADLGLVSAPFDSASDPVQLGATRRQFPISSRWSSVTTAKAPDGTPGSAATPQAS